MGHLSESQSRYPEDHPRESYFYMLVNMHAVYGNHREVSRWTPHGVRIKVIDELIEETEQNSTLEKSDFDIINRNMYENFGYTIPMYIAGLSGEKHPGEEEDTFVIEHIDPRWNHDPIMIDRECGYTVAMIYAHNEVISFDDHWCHDPDVMGSNGETVAFAYASHGITDFDKRWFHASDMLCNGWTVAMMYADKCVVDFDDHWIHNPVLKSDYDEATYTFDIMFGRTVAMYYAENGIVDFDQRWYHNNTIRSDDGDYDFTVAMYYANAGITNFDPYWNHDKDLFAHGDYEPPTVEGIYLYHGINDYDVYWKGDRTVSHSNSM